MSQEAKARVAPVSAVNAAPLAAAAASAQPLPQAPLAPPQQDSMALMKGILANLGTENIGKSLAREQDLDYMSETSAAALQGPPKVTHVVL